MSEELISLRVPSSIQDFPIGEDSMVWVVGGWYGKHASYYVETYGCNVVIFEPQADVADALVRQFKGKPKVKVFPYGLGTETVKAQMSRAGTDRCSFVHRLEGKDLGETTFEGPYIRAAIKDIAEVVQELGAPDLCLMNCEGSEWVLLSYMVNTGLMSKFRFLMVQFHAHHEGVEMLDAILEGMAKTHQVRDDYYPAWITWEPKPKPRKPRKPRAKKPATRKATNAS